MQLQLLRPTNCCRMRSTSMHQQLETARLQQGAVAESMCRRADLNCLADHPFRWASFLQEAQTPSYAQRPGHIVLWTVLFTLQSVSRRSRRVSSLCVLCASASPDTFYQVSRFWENIFVQYEILIKLYYCYNKRSFAIRKAWSFIWQMSVLTTGLSHSTIRLSSIPLRVIRRIVLHTEHAWYKAVCDLASLRKVFRWN